MRNCFFFFCNISLCLFVISILLLNKKYETCFLYEWMKGEEIGILSFSIFLGYLFVWYYSIEERKREFSVLQMLGISRWKLQWNLQLELFRFQVFVTILLILLFVHIGSEIIWLRLLKSILRVHLELQIFMGGIVWILLQQTKEKRV